MDEHLLRLRSSDFVQFNGITFKFNLDNRKKWRTDQPLELTKSQIKWASLYNFDVVKTVKAVFKVPCPNFVRFWFFDAIHIVLPVLYKRECCCACGEKIGSFHFVRGCKFRTKCELLSLPLAAREAVGSYLCWRMHCFKKHRDDSFVAKWIGMLHTLMEGFRVECSVAINTNHLNKLAF